MKNKNSKWKEFRERLKHLDKFEIISIFAVPIGCLIDLACMLLAGLCDNATVRAVSIAYMCISSIALIIWYFVWENY